MNDAEKARVSAALRDIESRHGCRVLFALKRHKPCVIDNTNVTVAERRRYIPLARKDKDARIVVYCFAPDLEGCLARNEKRTGRAHVPEVAIRCKLAN